MDLLTASVPLPTLVKTAQGRQQIMQALKADTDRSINDAIAARDYYGEKQSLRGFKYPSETERQPIPKEPGKPSTSFVANQVYTDAKGNKARYLGNGKWQEIK